MQVHRVYAVVLRFVFVDERIKALQANQLLVNFFDLAFQMLQFLASRSTGLLSGRLFEIFFKSD